ncbi:ribonuclease D [Teredinibacter purpureus]|uniref:ribonuclease D n=1 Tax=Teredinibacter purpureus TaxID=2731756 RepID=UPI0005F84613|nr:ribonuclease D [Teredinibacter purpureus]
MSQSLCTQEIHWVDTEKSLNELCQRWQASNILAVDTEFMRSQTYYPIAGLIQVNDGNANYLIDPVAIADCSAFAALLINPTIIKVLHSCSEDLEVFQRLLNVVPVNLFDTQIAAALCGYGFSVGYGNLVKAILNKDLPKTETRSDWLQRPLSASQIEYAAIDVEDLFQLAKILVLKLKNVDRLFWLTEECEHILQTYLENQDENKCHVRFKQAWKLNPQKLGVLIKLAVWRERQAKQRDIPRNRVVKEHSLLDIAMTAPNHVGQLRRFDGIAERMIRTDGEHLIQLVQEAMAVDPADYPKAMDKPLTNSENKWVKAMRARIVALAEELDVAPEILLKKRDYEAITRAFIHKEPLDTAEIASHLKSTVGGWRYAIVAEPLADVIGSIQSLDD